MRMIKPRVKLAMKTLDLHLTELGFMQRDLKSRCMVFQCEAKEDAAKRCGLPYWAFYTMAYADLALINWQAPREPLMKWWKKNKKEATKRETARRKEVLRER